MTAKAYRLETEPGGQLPDMGRLLQATIGDLSDNLAGYILVGLGQMLVVLVASVVLVPALYIGMALIFCFGSMLSGLLSGIVMAITNSDGLAAVFSLFGTLLTFACTFGAMFLLIGGLIALIAPVTGSLNRAVAAHQRGEGKLDFNGAFSTAKEELIPGITVTAITTGIILLGVMMCYIPGIFAMGLLSFAPCLVYLHRRSATQAVSMAVTHAMANPQFYLVFCLAMFGITLIASYIPLLGPAFIVAFHVRAFRMVFGDHPSEG